MKKGRVVQNTTMLYLMNFAKLVFPLMTLPYLARVLSVEGYGIVSYVKAVMTYMQLIIDFGFILSGTKDIVDAKDDLDRIGKITGDTIVAKLILSLVSLIVLMIMITFIPILRQNVLFTIFSFAAVFQTIFLQDFLFRGLEQMQIITIRYVITRVITTSLTFLVIHGDGNVIEIPLLDIIGNMVAIIWVNRSVKKFGIKISYTGIIAAVQHLKDSFVYFASNMASTAFGALNTLMVGLIMSSRDVAFWGLAMQLVNAVQSLYSPIINGIYPQMIRDKNLKLIERVLLIFMPLIFVGCLIIFFFAGLILSIIGGHQYVAVAPLLKWFIPLIFISFPSMLFGWPVLGAIDKAKETSITTIVTAMLQVLGLLLLGLIGQFNLIALAILRGATELFMMSYRIWYCSKYRYLFSYK